MRNIYITILCALALASSCGKYLDQYSHTAIPPESVTTSDVPTVRIGMYERVQNCPGVRSYIIMDVLGGFITQNTYNPIDLMNAALKGGSTMSTQWNGFYAALYHVNNMISIASRFSDHEMSRTALGEAYYFRAWIYLNLTISFGGVPILRENTLEKVARNSAEECWAFIDENLDEAAKLLGKSSSYYYVSLNAVKALKARVCLYEGKKEEAFTLAEELITSGGYKLDDFTDIFSISRPTNTETIFAFMIQNTQESSIEIGNEYYTYGYTNKGKGTYRLTQEAEKMFVNSDKRRSSSVLIVDGINCLNKYPSGQAGTDPFIVSRLGEMYLISAEAQGYPAGMARLNELRSFRGLGPASAHNESSFIDAILTERGLELLGENQMFYDYVRTGTAVDKLGIKPYQQLFPIPETEIDRNRNIKQNPGYGGDTE